MTPNQISLDDIRQRLSSGRVLRIIDVRTPAEFGRVHAAGAENVPLDAFDATIVAARGASDDDPIYLICQAGPRAQNAWQKLQATGFGPAFCIAGGTSAWEAAGLPVVRGASTAISLERQVRIAAGALVFIGSMLGISVSRMFLGIPIFVGAGLMFAGITDYCGMGMLLAKMPWNQAGCGHTCASKASSSKPG